MTYKILHYINRFFAGIGGEDKADFEPKLVAGAVGPGAQLDKLLDGKARICATYVCGDNYFAEHTDAVLADFKKALDEYRPDIIIAGPSFYAGRYGFACGHVIRLAHETLGIPGVAGMNFESPAVEMFRDEMYIVKTGNSARAIKPALEDMAKLAEKLLEKRELGSAAEENYFHRHIRNNFFREENGGKRAVEMLLKKMKCEPFTSEYLQAIPEKVAVAKAVGDLSKATVALLNTGGIVPAGNPDKIESSSATKYGVYPLDGAERLEPGAVISIHGGYDTSFANADPNRIVPVDVMRGLEKEGVIGKLHEYYYTTAGTGASLLNGEAFGRGIAETLSKAGVDAAIMVST